MPTLRTSFQSPFQNPMASTFPSTPAMQANSSQHSKDTLTFAGGPKSLLVIDPATATNAQFRTNVSRLWERHERIGVVTDLPISETETVSWNPQKPEEFKIVSPDAVEIYTIGNSGQITVLSKTHEELASLVPVPTLVDSMMETLHRADTTPSHDQIRRLTTAMIAIFNHRKS